MAITTIGPWVLLAAGLVLMIAAVSLARVGNRFKELVIFLILGVALSGTSVWGLGFLGQYRDFLTATNLLNQMLTNPDTTTYGQAFASVGKGEVKPQYQRAILAVALQRPVEGLDRALTENADRATDADGRQALREASADLAGKQEAAGLVQHALASSGTAGARLERLDLATRVLVARGLQALPTERRRQLDVDAAQLKRMGEIQAVRPSARDHAP